MTVISSTESYVARKSLFLNMGIDVCSYRARIGSFFASRMPRCVFDSRFSAGTSLIRVLSPRPSTLLLSVCLALLLLCAGDVEANPGPKIEDVLTLLKKCHDETTSSLTEIKQQITGIEARLSSLEKTVHKVPDLTGNVETVIDTVQKVKENVCKTNEGLAGVVDDMNNRMRRNNLIIKGLPEEEHEGYVESERIVKEFFLKHLQIEAGEIERAHRLGKPRPDFDRPIIVKFLNYKSKLEALSNAPKLKDPQKPKVWLEEDFSPKVQLARKKLRDYAKAQRKGDEKYTVRFNKLQMHDSTFCYDIANDCVVKVSTTKKQNPPE